MADISDYQEALAAAEARLESIAKELNGIANAMASVVMGPPQLVYWRKVVERCYDLARQREPQPSAGEKK
jgi:hypothetical protein